MKIVMSGEEIRMLAEFALGVPIDSETCNQTYSIETGVVVGNKLERFYVSDTDYPEEGGSTLQVD